MDANRIPMASAAERSRLEGKVALITGGASGIGKATAGVFVKHGAKVVIADVQDELGFSVCQELGSGDAVFYVHCDVSEDDDVRNAVDNTVSRYGKLDIMYINAGISGNMNPLILESANEDFKRVLHVNLFGAYLGAKHAARVMIPAKRGSILFTASMCTVSGGGPYAYMASKRGIVGVAKNLALELGAHGIRVNCISPFCVATPMLKNALGIEDTKKVEELVSGIATLKGAILDPEDIAYAALYLASDESKYVSGINLVIDGGFSNTNLVSQLKFDNNI